MAVTVTGFAPVTPPGTPMSQSTLPSSGVRAHPPGRDELGRKSAAFTFVTDGVARCLESAQEAAGDKQAIVMGVRTGRQLLARQPGQGMRGGAPSSTLPSRGQPHGQETALAKGAIIVMLAVLLA
ncbi:hypothetical protein ETD86_49900, partial [Nonomuraea turkmeniaca]